MNLNPGDLYFIREVDVLDQCTSDYCKIGLVKDSRAGDAETRAQEHQTGNPRRLVLAGMVSAPAVSDLEASMHQRYATRRIHGEWFELPDEADIAAAIKTAQQLADQQSEHLEALTSADRLKSLESTDASLDPTDDHRYWHERAHTAKSLKKLTGNLLKRSQAVFKDSVDSGHATDLFATVTKRDKAIFAEDRLAESHPELYESYLKTTPRIIPRFTLKKPTYDLSVAMPADLTDFAERFDPLIDRAADNPDLLEDLHLGHLELLGFVAGAGWEFELAEANLKAACGDAAGIDGLLTWSRVRGETVTFDVRGFKSAYPELHEQFTTIETSTAVAVNPMRSYRARLTG